MNKFSPTNLIADIRAGFAVILLGYVLFHLFTDKAFDAEKAGIIVTALWALGDKLLGSVSARYTADADSTDPVLKANANAGTGTAAVLIVCACIAVGTFLSACAGISADLASPSGKALEADLFSDVTTITAAALTKGTNLSADVAAADSLGGTFEAYSTLPTTTAQLSALASTASSTSTNLSSVAPKIAALVETYTKKGMTPVVAKQTVAKAVYGATAIQTASH